MPRKHWIGIGLAIGMTLSSCVSQSVAPTLSVPAPLTSTSLPTPVLTETLVPVTATHIAPTPTTTPKPTLTATPTLPPTLEPQQAAAAIAELLQSPQCRAPCFWGIIPGQTTVDEAKGIFAHLGVPLRFLNPGGLQYSAYATNDYRFPSGLSVAVSLIVQDQRISTVRATISPEVPKDIRKPRDWLAYSPDTLIRMYGIPSRVDFWGGMSHETGAPLNLNYLLDVYFNAADLIVEYNSAYDFVKIDPATGLVRICPVTDQFQGVGIWLGKNPYGPPSPGVSISDATSMTVEEFSAKMTGDLKDACFDVRRSLFNN